MKLSPAIAVVILASACAPQGSDEITVDTVFTRDMAESTLKEAPFGLRPYKVHAVCGPSRGMGLFPDNTYADFRSDGISGGRLIFISDENDQNANVLFRDSSGSYISSVTDGAEVKIIGEDTRKTWIVSYPATGVAETHNIFATNGGTINVWTSNKPATAVSGETARVFQADCQVFGGKQEYSRY